MIRKFESISVLYLMFGSLVKILSVSMAVLRVTLVGRKIVENK